MSRVMLTAFLLVTVLGTAALASSYNYLAPVQMKAWLESGKKMQIVDIQVPAEFQKHHLKGSVETGAFPVKSAEEKQKLDRVIPALAAGREDIVVVCPRGGGGAKNTADYLKEKGIAEGRIFILENGMQGWPYKELAEAAK
jgi:rhodanese-related sulfurtransferase